TPASSAATEITYTARPALSPPNSVARRALRPVRGPVRSLSGVGGVIGVHLQMGTRLVVRDACELLDRGALLVGQFLGHGDVDGDEEVTGRGPTVAGHTPALDAKRLA